MQLHWISSKSFNLASGASNGIMRVTILHLDLGIGGAEQLIVNMATVMKELGHEVLLLTSHHDKNHCFEETKPNGIIVLCTTVLLYILLMFSFHQQGNLVKAFMSTVIGFHDNYLENSLRFSRFCGCCILPSSPWCSFVVQRTCLYWMVCLHQSLSLGSLVWKLSSIATSPTW